VCACWLCLLAEAVGFVCWALSAGLCLLGFVCWLRLLAEAVGFVCWLRLLAVSVHKNIQSVHHIFEKARFLGAKAIANTISKKVYQRMALPYSKTSPL